MADTPNSYKDPYWSDLADRASSKVGAPAGVLKAILLQGEKSNNDQVSSAGARTPFQITPTTAKLIEKKYGINPYLSPENAAEGAALLIKESSDRNKGDIERTVREYHGGTNPKNWGPVNDAYVGRVVGNAEKIKQTTLLSDFDKWASQQGFGANSNDQSAQVKQIGADFDSSMAAKSTNQNADKATDTAPDIAAIGADFDQWKAAQPAAPEAKPDLGFFGGIKEAITGAQRATPESQTLPEWTGMPELNQMSMASAKTGIGTMFAAPDEIVQVIKSNFPNAQIRQDDKGNFIIKSPSDGKDYVIPPGVSMGDIPRIIGGIAAFTPAAKAGTMLGSAAASAGTQAVIEGTQAATGGNFSATDVALAGAVGGLVPPVMRGVQAVGGLVASPIKGALNKVLGREAAPIAEAQMGGVTKAAPDAIIPQAGPVAQAVPEVVPTAVKAAPMQADELAGIARKAGLGDEKAIKTLAEQAAPNAKTVQAAKNLGVEDYLQADHVSTNQAVKELFQMLKSVPTSQMAIAEKEGLSRAAKVADDLITKLGGNDDLASVSQGVKQSLSKTHADLGVSEGKLYKDLKTGIGADTAVAAPTVLNFVKSRIKDVGGVENLSALERKVLKKLSPTTSSSPDTLLRSQGNSKVVKQPTYTALDDMRKEIGDATRGKGVFKDANQGMAKKLYALISSDQEIIARAHKVGDVFDAARSTTVLRKGVEDDLTALFGKTLDGSISRDISGAVSSISKGDNTKLLSLIKSVPDDMRQEVVASGLGTVLGKKANTFGAYADWYEGLLKNKQAHTAIMANLPPSARKSLSDLYRVSRDVSNTTKLKIPTGRLTEGMKRLNSADSLAGKIYENVKYDLPATLAGTAAGVAASAVAGPMVGGGIGLAIKGALSKGARTEGVAAAEKLIMSPEFKETVIQAAKGEPEVAVKKLAKSVIFVDFIKKARVADMESMSKRERWILQALEANQQQSNSR